MDVISPRNQIGRYEHDNLGLVGPDWKQQRAGHTADDQDPEGEALLDANDVLVFMAADLGDRASTSVETPVPQPTSATRSPGRTRSATKTSSGRCQASRRNFALPSRFSSSLTIRLYSDCR